MLDDSEEKTYFVTIAVGSGAHGGRGVAGQRKNGGVHPLRSPAEGGTS